jgi:hypothetical protein
MNKSDIPILWINDKQIGGVMINVNHMIYAFELGAPDGVWRTRVFMTNGVSFVTDRSADALDNEIQRVLNAEVTA